MKLKLIILVLFSTLVMASERFSNTNGVINDKSLKDLLKWSFTNKTPKRVKIETSDDWKNINEKEENYIVWIGHATFLINVEGINILTDPVFSNRSSPVRFAGPKRYIPPAIPLDKLPKIDVVTVSHNHYDHLDIRALKSLYNLNSDTIFLVPKGDKKLLVKKGIEKVHEFHWWDEILIDKNAKFIFTPVQHWSARNLRDRNKSLWGGWYMNFPSKKIYHAGDTGYSKDFMETKKRLGSPDISFIPIGAYAPRWFMKENHVNPAEAIQIALDLDSKVSFGMHWGTFPLTDEEVLEPPKFLVKELEKEGLDNNIFRTLKPGEVIRH